MLNESTYKIQFETQAVNPHTSNHIKSSRQKTNETHTKVFDDMCPNHSEKTNANSALLQIVAASRHKQQACNDQDKP